LSKDHPEREYESQVEVEEDAHQEATSCQGTRGGKKGDRLSAKSPIRANAAHAVGKLAHQEEEPNVLTKKNVLYSSEKNLHNPLSKCEEKIQSKEGKWGQLWVLLKWGGGNMEG